MLPHHYRLTSTRDFKETFSKGRKIQGNVFTLFVRQGKGAVSQFGIVVPNSVSKKAVERNRIKRIVRSFVEKQTNIFEKGYLCVLVAKKQAERADKVRLEEDLNGIFFKGLQ